MNFKTNQKIMWTMLELHGLLEADDSCVHFKNTKKHLALHPFHLKDLQRALNEILMSMINTYDTELKGFLLSYKKPKLLSNLGRIFYDSCFIHVDIEADFYLFCPKVGCSLKGIVNKKGLDHIVLLIHKVFTVTIPKPDNEEEEWLGNTVEIGQEVKCCVTHIDRSTKLPSICATLNTDYLQGCRLPETFNNIDNASTNVKLNTNGIEGTTNGLNITISKDSVVFNTENVKIKIENPDPEAHTEDNIESSYQSQINNDDTDTCNNSNLNEYTESRKRKKREYSETDTSTYEPERKKKKKHSKKSRESDLESMHMTVNEENIINDTANIGHHIKCTKEEQQDNKKRKEEEQQDNKKRKVEEQQDNKKRKKSKKMIVVMSDSEPEDHIVKIKEEKPDPIIDKIIGKSLKNHKPSSYEVINTPNLDEHMETDVYIKTEDSDKEKKKKSKKRQKTSRNTDSESEFRIKSENKIINNISKTNKYNDEDVKDGEQARHTKYNAVESDVSSNISDPDHVSRKPKKSKKSSKASPDLKSKYHVKIKEEEED
ncbi:PREDICTED: DNA-directed RNA polymerase I subunit RPA43-like [Dinoponera quadriceps]|uniref:DNA-directed RNA polymerase I subunit RPA43-like n=1 Tax=Dinoponera quadriceps TaxID=609295 RepID=A0A6P3XNG3_DINQU|nr:PREDICTED: DNA-directed RNA polymerase I subunit RPA43-like [Dinoponera quadriceps]XP_014480005.1 PREDICTED: DNA-directed RNA polymerase I subunit RPA43-like [Dinoponera quadriceps]